MNTLKDQLILKGQYLQLNNPNLAIFSKDDQNPYYIDSIILKKDDILNRGDITLVDIDLSPSLDWTLVFKGEGLNSETMELLIDLIDTGDVYYCHHRVNQYFIILVTSR